MSEQLQSENRNALAGIAATIAFPYLWLGLFVFLGWLYHVGFFGRDWGSIIVPALLCLVLLTPVVPAALSRFVVRPLFSNLLGREIIAASGCITGLVSVVAAGFATLHFLSRGMFDVAAGLLSAAPIVGALLAGGVTLLSRGGILRGLSQRRNPAPPGNIQIEKPPVRALPGVRTPPSLTSSKRSALPSASSRSTTPSTRRPTERPGSSSKTSARRPSPPPRRNRP